LAEEGRRLNVEPSRLEAQVRFWMRRRICFRAGDLTTSLTGSVVCFTFDDAYESALSHGCEVLERNRAWGSFYAVTRKVGLTSDWDGELARPLASWQVLRDAQARGHEIGNHTRTHPRLNEVDIPEEEILGAEQDLRDHGFNVSSFCYPYGAADERSLELVGQAHMPGLGLLKGEARPGSDRRFLPRVVVGYSDTLPMLIFKAFVRPRLPGPSGPGLSPPRAGL